MEAYLASGLFRTYANSFVYVERTLQNGSLRKGLVGMVDLEAYDYNPGSTSPIRATERTVTERIPPPAGPAECQPGAAPYFAPVRRRPEGPAGAHRREEGVSHQAV